MSQFSGDIKDKIYTKSKQNNEPKTCPTQPTIKKKENNPEKDDKKQQNHIKFNFSEQNGAENAKNNIQALFAKEKPPFSQFANNKQNEVQNVNQFVAPLQKSDDQFNFSNLNQFQKYLVQREEKTFTMQQIDKYAPRIQNEMLKIVADPLLSLQFISKMSILKLELRLCPKIHMDLESVTLKEQTMYNCPMDNMNWVQNVKHLQLLDLNYIDKLDLNKIAEFLNLTDLRLNQSISRFTPLTALGKIQSLKTLELVDSDCINIKPIGNLKQLTHLTIIKCGVRDLSVLSSLLNLTTLNVVQNNINNISNLRKLVNLKQLNLQFNQVREIKVISKFINLEELNISGNYNVNIEPIKNLKHVKYLYLSSIGLRDLSVIRNLQNIEYLDVSSNELVNIQDLLNMHRLKGCNLSLNKISSFYDLQNSSFHQFNEFFQTANQKQATKRDIKKSYQIRIIYLLNEHLIMCQPKLNIMKKLFDLKMKGVGLNLQKAANNHLNFSNIVSSLFHQIVVEETQQ
ncbi:leucine_Rich Repeat (LRR)-containing protein [Hexamita inflata]|uniref:Leucine Rich Repeat (LRR)-containing protein n=1 Tax=Hexamita inflata TaxID=28002 RepID=A0AA86RJ50_9EUKA|nr:leucine Rich Repeat (LRR)-containing protein [Hexamita inflata]